MTHVDWIIVGIIGLSSVIGLFRGFIKEALSLLGWLAAFVLASTFANSLGAMFTGIEAPSLRYLAAFGSIFIVSLIALALVNSLLSVLVEATGLNGTDRVLGAAFGIGRGFILVLAIVILLPGVVPVEQDTWWKNSLLIPEFSSLEGWARTTFNSLYEWLSSFIGR